MVYMYLLQSARASGLEAGRQGPLLRADSGSDVGGQADQALQALGVPDEPAQADPAPADPAPVVPLPVQAGGLQVSSQQRLVFN